MKNTVNNLLLNLGVKLSRCSDSLILRIDVWVGSNVVLTLWNDENKRRSIRAYVVAMLTRVEAIYLEVRVYVVLMNTMIDNVAVVSAVAVPKGYGHPMRELWQLIKWAFVIDGQAMIDALIVVLVCPWYKGFVVGGLDMSKVSINLEFLCIPYLFPFFVGEAERKLIGITKEVFAWSEECAISNERK
jgi:hypothetical protein